tara:strand:- start:615 stop:881 length:267 start_codon:yes stop_codon:yes gene_type:complete
MKKLILSAMMILTMSCESEIQMSCECVEVQEVNREIKAWTGGAWYYYYQWEETGTTQSIEGCYTDEEISYMVRQVGANQRWFITCKNN